MSNKVANTSAPWLCSGHRVIFVWGKAHGDVESLRADTLWLYLEHLAFSYKSISLVDAKRDWLEHEVRNYCATSEPVRQKLGTTTHIWTPITHSLLLLAVIVNNTDREHSMLRHGPFIVFLLSILALRKHKFLWDFCSVSALQWRV